MRNRVQGIAAVVCGIAGAAVGGAAFPRAVGEAGAIVVAAGAAGGAVSGIVAGTTVVGLVLLLRPPPPRRLTRAEVRRELPAVVRRRRIWWTVLLVAFASHAIGLAVDPPGVLGDLLAAGTFVLYIFGLPILCALKVTSAHRLRRYRAAAATAAPRPSTSRNRPPAVTPANDSTAPPGQRTDTDNASPAGTAPSPKASRFSSLHM